MVFNTLLPTIKKKKNGGNVITELQTKTFEGQNLYGSGKCLWSVVPSFTVD